MTGIEVFLEILASAGVRYIFGNPGTTELPLTDALVNERRVQYIFGVQEIPVMAMADGFAMASGQLGVINVHASCGLGNSMGMLYNAHVEGTPLLLTAGQQDRRLRFSEPVLDGDLVSVTRPWTKWSYEVQRVEDLASAVRRAVQIALTPPTGPVFLALPVDLQMETLHAPDLVPAAIPDRRQRPSVAALHQAVALLSQARQPAILAGSRVMESQAGSELAAFAQLLGAPVFAENTTMHGRLPMATDQPLYAGILPYWSPDIQQKLAEFDLLFVVGMNLLRLYIYHEPARPIAPTTRIIHLDNAPWEIGKNYPVEVPLLGDPKCALVELIDLLKQTKLDHAHIQQRSRKWTDRQATERSSVHQRIQTEWDSNPLTPHALMGALGRTLPANTAIIEEAITTHQNVLEKLGFFTDPSGHFAHRGWALGWGLGCALGVKLAWPDRPVVALLGDGSALYGIQGLWSAAHHNIPVTFVICNNTQYKILKVCGDVMPLPHMKQGKYLGMDLVQPEVDFVGLARSFGVEGHRVESAAELCTHLREGVKKDKPQLLEVKTT